MRARQPTCRKDTAHGYTQTTETVFANSVDIVSASRASQSTLGSLTVTRPEVEELGDGTGDETGKGDAVTPSLSPLARPSSLVFRGHKRHLRGYRSRQRQVLRLEQLWPTG